MTRLSLSLLLIASLNAELHAQSGTDPLQFGQNLDFAIRSDQLDLSGVKPAIGERVLYGFSVAATDEILVVGAPHCDERGSTRSGDFAGAVYVYQRAGESWEPFSDINGLPFEDGRDFKLFPSGLQAGDFFGWSVDLAKNEDGSHSLVVGAPGTRHAENGRSDTGTVYLFELEANSFCWKEAEDSPFDFHQVTNLHSQPLKTGKKMTPRQQSGRSQAA